MKKVLNVTVILSWFNLIVAGTIAIIGLIMAAFTPGTLAILTSIVLVSAVILHSYAALQLRKTLLYPSVPLSRQTPTGIRFIGLMALFYALLNGGYAILILQHTAEFASQIKIPAGAEKMPIAAFIRFGGGFSLLFSASIACNVFLNLRLLAQWYREQMPKNN